MDRKIQLLSNPAFHLGKSIFRGRLDAQNYIDMGLPSGTKWAASNLDVMSETGLAASPFQYECSFFSWGNVEGHNPVSESDFDYNFGDVNAQEPWYEGQPYGVTPGSTLRSDITINARFDAARALLRTPWCMPLVDDFKELFDNCIYIDAEGNEVENSNPNKIVSVNGISGIYLQSKINNARIFFPAAGRGTMASWRDRGVVGFLWTRTFVTDRQARYIQFNDSGVIQTYDLNRYEGCPIRPIMK